MIPRGNGEEVVIEGPVIGEGFDGHGGDGGNVGDQIHVVGECDIVGETVMIVWLMWKICWEILTMIFIDFKKYIYLKN